MKQGDLLAEEKSVGKSITKKGYICCIPVVTLLIFSVLFYLDFCFSSLENEPHLHPRGRG